MNKLIEKLADLKFRQKVAQEKLERAINDDELNTASEEIKSLAKEISETESEIRSVEKDNEEFRNREMGGKEKMGNAIYTRNNQTNLEYRKKFMDAVQNFNLSQLEKRADAHTTTKDIEIVIPENLVNDIVTEVTNRGYILSRVNKTNFAIGQTIPVGMTKVTATWVGTTDGTNNTGEGLGSSVQKAGIQSYVVFSNYKLRCVVGMTHEAGLQSLEVFERKFVESVSEAMVEALETAVVSGTGINQPKGILMETPKTGRALTLAAAEEFTYANLLKFVGSIPSKYKAGAVIFATQNTFFQWLGVTDTQGQPVARTNYGINGEMSQSLFGMPVIFADEYLQDYVAGGGTVDNVFAFAYNFKEYTLNTNYDLGLSERTVWENENREIKAVMAVDGKAVTINSLVTWKKSKKG